MNIKEVFKKSKVNTKTLSKYGFIKNNNIYTYTKDILDDFKLIVEINEEVSIKVIDKDLDEEYTAIYVESEGTFVNTVKEEVLKVLLDIKDKCFIESYFIYPQSNRITNLIKKEYGNIPEFLWEDYEGAVFRNNDKWYGIIMHINKNKISNEDKDIEVLNIKLNEKEIEVLLTKKGYYKAYHMNKKSWISIPLDDTLNDKEIFELIKKSHKFTEISKEWIVPANANYFDVIDYFDSNKEVLWKQSSSIQVGDIVYIYVGSPYSALLYKTKATKVNEDYFYERTKKNGKAMYLEVLKSYPKDKYTFKRLNELGVKAIRGPRHITKDLKDALDKE